MSAVLTPSKRFNIHADKGSEPRVRTKEPTTPAPVLAEFVPAEPLPADPPLTLQDGTLSVQPGRARAPRRARARCPFSTAARSRCLASLPRALYPPSVVDVLSWRSSATIPIVCSINVLLLAAASASATSLLSYSAKLFVAGVAVGFGKRHVLGGGPSLPAVSADDIALVARRFEHVANTCVTLLNRVVCAHDLRLAIVSVGVLYAFTVAASVMSVGTMVYALLAVAFGTAPLYRLTQDQCEMVRARGKRRMRDAVRPRQRRRASRR
jgi:hypothetical protein